jgi:hypothetical protein
LASRRLTLPPDDSMDAVSSWSASALAGRRTAATAFSRWAGPSPTSAGMRSTACSPAIPSLASRQEGADAIVAMDTASQAGPPPRGVRIRPPAVARRQPPPPARFRARIPA